MNARYRTNRRGPRRRDQVPVALVERDSLLGEALVSLARLPYRYRSELAPLTLAAALFVAAAILHGGHRSWAVPLAALTAALTGLLVAMPRGWARRWPVLDRRPERLYGAFVVATAGGWLAAATIVGPGTRPLPTVALVCTLAGAVPWWVHRRRRAKVRVERTLEAWPTIADGVGLAGSRVLSAVVDTWGYTVRIALRRGQPVRSAIEQIPAIESGLATRPGAVRVEPDPARADHLLMRVIERDPHARPIPLPAKTTDSVAQPIELGVFEDGSAVRVLLLRRHALIGGVVGSGKSGVLNAILAHLSSCRDVDLWGIDLKGGMELLPWRSCLARLATTRADAVALLRDGVSELDRRAARSAGSGQRVWEPTASERALVIVIDEFAELPEEAAEYADSIARRGRAVAVTLLVATQRPTQRAMGRGSARSQMDIRICLRVRERRDVDLILGQGMLSAGWSAHSLDSPGKFLISSPEHQTLRRARAFHITDADVARIANENARDSSDNWHAAESDQAERPADGNPETVLWNALLTAPDGGMPIRELIRVTGQSRSWVYRRLGELAKAGRAVQTQRGHWRATDHG